MSQYPPPPSSQFGQPLQYHNPIAAAPARPASVTVIAILVIIFSSFGLLCSPFGLLPFFVNAVTQADPVQAAIYGNPLFKVWTFVSVIVGWILALINLIAAINALSLKGWARRMMVKIAIMQLVFGVINIVATLGIMLPPLLELGQTDPTTKIGAIVGVIGGIVGGLFAMVLPALTVYFFRQPNVIEAFDRPTLGEPGMPGVTVNPF